MPTTDNAAARRRADESNLPDFLRFVPFIYRERIALNGAQWSVKDVDFRDLLCLFKF